MIAKMREGDGNDNRRLQVREEKGGGWGRQMEISSFLPASDGREHSLTCRLRINANDQRFLVGAKLKAHNGLP